jgi:hypothetical protein
MSFLKSVMFVSVLLLPAIATEARGEEREVKKIEWENAKPKGGVWEFSAPAEGKRIRILTLQKPGIKELSYAIKGEVSYEDVKDTGFLEMWNYFPDGGFFFTRTLGGGGPMGSLEGSSDWREFVLPFNAGKGQTPNKLEVNIVLPSSGKVKLKSAVLVEYSAPTTKDAKPQAALNRAGWWGDRQGGMMGAAIGCIGGLYGTVIGLLVPRGKARRFVLSLMMTMAGSGSVMLMVGLVALALRQPYAVWYPLVMSGVILGILSLSLLPGVKRQYDQIELRRMTAMDAAGI